MFSLQGLYLELTEEVCRGSAGYLEGNWEEKDSMLFYSLGHIS